MTDQDTQPTLDGGEAPEPVGRPIEDAPPPVGWAVYDLTLRRFIGGVHSTKAKATKAADIPEGHETETRRV